MDEAQEQMAENASMGQNRFGQFGEQMAQFQNMAGAEEDDDRGLPALNILFFGAGCTLMFGSFLGMFTMFFSFSFADCLGLVYVFCFGMVVAILDAPVQSGANPLLVMAEQSISKYFTFLTGTTGKGTCLLMSACLLACLMFSNFDSTLLKFLEFWMVGGVVFVGGFGISIGSKKTHDLNNVREQILNSCPGGVHQVESAMCPYALTFPPDNGSGHCLTMEEFNKFINEVAQCDEYSHEDLVLIFKSLRQRRPGMHKSVAKLTMEDVESWLEGRRILI